MGGFEVNKKLNQIELFETMNSKLTELSKKQIRALILKELKKNADDIDMNYIDLCYELLEIKNNSSTEENNKVGNQTKHFQILIASVIIIIIVLTTITVSACVFNFNVS